MKDQNFGDWMGEQLVNISKAGAYDVVAKSADYWQKRCKAAEELLGWFDRDINKESEYYKEWEQLKKDEFKPL